MKVRKIVLICFVILLLGGCKMNNVKNNPTREEVTQAMLDYVEKKYDKEFECESMEYKDWANKGRELMYTYPKDRTDDRIFVVKRFKKDGKIKFTDGYVGYLMEPKYVEKYEEIVKKYFPDCILRVQFPDQDLYPSFMNENTTYEEFKKYTDHVTGIYASLIIPVNNEKEANSQIELMRKSLSEEFGVGGVAVYGFNHDDYNSTVREIYNELGLDTVMDRALGALSDIRVLHRNNDVHWGQIDFDYPDGYYKVEEN